MIAFVLDHIRKPRNLGAVVRVAAATGARLVLTGDSGDPARASARFGAVGTTGHVAIQRLAALSDAVVALRAEGFRLFGTSARASSVYWDVEYRGPVALVFGNEVGGLRKAKLALLDGVVGIPMPGAATAPVESLNLATAVAVVAYEVLRQRSQA